MLPSVCSGMPGFMYSLVCKYMKGILKEVVINTRLAQLESVLEPRCNHVGLLLDHVFLETI